MAFSSTRPLQSCILRSTWGKSNILILLFSLHHNIKCCTSFARYPLGILRIKEVQDNKFSNIATNHLFSFRFISHLIFRHVCHLSPLPESARPLCLCALDQALAYAHPSSFCWGITAHRPMCQPWALTFPPEPHTVPLTTACRCLKSTCVKPNSVSCILFPHQVCLHHSHSMLNLFVFFS